MNLATWSVLELAVVFLGMSVLISSVVLVLGIALATRNIRRSLAELGEVVDIHRRGTYDGLRGLTVVAEDIARTMADDGFRPGGIFE